VVEPAGEMSVKASGLPVERKALSEPPTVEYPTTCFAELTAVAREAELPLGLPRLMSDPPVCRKARHSPLMRYSPTETSRPSTVARPLTRPVS
jgi:hypothetical protein